MSDHTQENDINYSGTVIKALDILDYLAEHRHPMSTQEIAKGCGMSRPTTYRLLTTLMSRGFIKDDGNYQYSLGLKFLSLSRLVLDELDLVEVARPFLHELCTISNETANLSILDNGELLYIGKEESLNHSGMPALVQLRSTVGTRLKPHSTAMGKAMMAYLPLEERETLLESSLPLKAYTVNTITDLDALRRELEQVRQHGYALDDREVDDGTRCIAAPIFDNTRQVVAAMSVAGPAYRVTRDTLNQLSREVVRIAHNLSHQLGYVGN
ncbi:MAG: IclR family transcriptional regulator [Anaerolineae bacterium]